MTSLHPVLSRAVLVLTAALQLAGATFVAGQPAEPGPAPEMVPTPGEIVGPIPTAQNPEHSYELYLPPRYSTEKKWPVLMIMDPRGRGRQAAEIFLPAAERFGFVLASSNNTASDVPDGEESPNAAALAAVTDDLARRLSLDGARLYLAGFSGTSRFAWAVGSHNPDQITGVIGCGGGMPGSHDRWKEIGFDYFGSAGTTDFNFAEMFQLDEILDKLDSPHRIEYFDGPHTWLPVEVATRAVGWMEIRAMRRGLRPIERRLIEALYSADLDRAAALEESGELYEAARLYRSISTDYDGLLPPGDAGGAADRLEQSPVVRNHAKRLTQAVEREQLYRTGLLEPFAALQPPNRPMSTSRLRETLNIEQLQRAAGGAGIESLSAQRQLAIVGVHMSFYQPRLLMSGKHYAHVVPVLEIATELHPRRADLWYNLACAQATTGRRAKALASLEQAVDLGFRNLEHIEADPDLERLRETKGYRQIVDRLRSGSVSESTR